MPQSFLGKLVFLHWRGYPCIFVSALSFSEDVRFIFSFLKIWSAGVLGRSDEGEKEGRGVHFPVTRWSLDPVVAVVPLSLSFSGCYVACRLLMGFAQS